MVIKMFFNVKHFISRLVLLHIELNHNNTPRWTGFNTEIFQMSKQNQKG